MSLLISLRSETLKLKRTLSVYLCILGAAFGPFMSFLENLHPDPGTKMGLLWTQHFLEGREPVNIALLPLYTVLVCTLLLQIEYRDKTWKQVLTSPQRIIDVFFAKFLSLHFMIFLFLFCYTISLVITGFATEMVNPEFYNGECDLLKILAINTQTWLLVLGMSSIQFWLSLRFRNFIAPVGIGIAGWFLAPMMLFEFKTRIVEYYPYAFTMLSVYPDYKANVVSHQWYSIVTTVLFLGLAFAEFKTRKVKS
jgi:lantibiotic transport system permease protein